MARRRNYGKRKARVPSKKTVVKKALARRSNAKIANVVKRVLSKQAEVKNANSSFSFAPASTIASVGTLATDNIVWVSPNSSQLPIIQGVRQDERVGNKIRTKRCKLKVIMYPKPYNATSNPLPRPQVVTMWCVSAKIGYTSNSSMATIFDTNFFQDGFTSTGYLSQLIDSISEINSDAITLHWKRSFKLGHSTHYAQPNQTTEPYPSNVQYSNNDYKMNIIREFDLTKALKKTYTFDDTNNTPNDRSTFIIWGIANADGTLFTADTRPVDVYATLDYYYTDM